MLPGDDVSADAAASAQVMARRALALIAELRGIEAELRTFLASAAPCADLEAAGEAEEVSEPRRGAAPVPYKGPMRWARG